MLTIQKEQISDILDSLTSLANNETLSKIEKDLNDGDTDSTLHFAIRNDSLQTLRILKDIGLDINEPFINYKETFEEVSDLFAYEYPIFEATDDGHFEVTKFFVEEWNANVNVLTHMGETPLSKVATTVFPHFGTIQELKTNPSFLDDIKKMMSPEDAKDFQEEFEHAKEVYKNVIKMVEYLLENGADPNLSETLSLRICTAIENRPEIVQVLIDHGADRKAQDYYSVREATRNAIRTGRMETLDILTKGDYDAARIAYEEANSSKSNFREGTNHMNNLKEIMKKMDSYMDEAIEKTVDDALSK